jgi:dihydropteroate synthase
VALVLSASELFPRTRVTLLGVLNLTPDSFSDGGRLLSGSRPNLQAAVDAADKLLVAGVHVLDVGGESTRPGAAEVPAELEIERTAPVIDALARRFAAPISIDTRKAAVAEAALAAGAGIVNDVSGLRRDPALARVAAKANAVALLGHLRGEPADMQREIQFEDVVREVARELGESLSLARAAGVASDRLAADPGIGFGKHLEHNLALLAHAGWLREQLGVPLVVGPSRKAFFGALTGWPVDARDVATAAACAVAIFAGADAIRVHDAEAGATAARIGQAMRAARRPELEAEWAARVRGEAQP